MGTKISISGLDALISQLSAVEQRALSKDMLRAAEPYLRRSLDSEMKPHAGPTAESLRSTGAAQNSRGGYYIAYRATDASPPTGEGKNRRTSAEKMFYLMTREFIVKTGHDKIAANGGSRKGLKQGKDYTGYVIPAYPTAAAAVAASEGQITEIMQQIFSKKIEDAWGKK